MERVVRQPDTSFRIKMNKVCFLKLCYLFAIKVSKNTDAQKTKTTVWTSSDSVNQRHLPYYPSLFSFLNQLLNTLYFGFLLNDHPRQNTTEKSSSTKVSNRMDYSGRSSTTTKCSLPLVNQRRVLSMDEAQPSLCDQEHFQSSCKQRQTSLSFSSVAISSKPYFYQLPLPSEPPLLLKHPLLSPSMSSYQANDTHQHYSSPFHVLARFLCNYFYIFLFIFLKLLQVFRDLGLFFLYPCSSSATRCDVHSSSFLFPRRLLVAFRQSILLVILFGTTFLGKFSVYVKQKQPFSFFQLTASFSLFFAYF